MEPEPDLSGISPEDVDAALDALWKGRSRVFEHLLDCHDGDAGGSDAVMADAASRGLPHPRSEAVPTVPNYTIVGELGRGGMGVIYEARQQHPQRLVALKVIRSGHLPGDQQIRLFEREIESLARLKHPHIAAIYEAGMTDDGRPFFAMELVRGETPVEFMRSACDAEQSEGARKYTVLRLFEKICDAINYAHQRGVIHRDLKPSNILVVEETPGSGSSTGSVFEPGVKVLDFGLARITDGGVSVTVTRDAGQVRGTLPYMAPEQIQGDAAGVDTRSDVYALGVLLFEMLTGKLPYDLRHSSMGRAVRLICETPPARPSFLCPDLRGDLETIILKALTKEPGHRYQSVAALREDVSRFLANQPILARPQSAFYQLRKFVARHRLTSAAFCALVLVAVVGFAVSASLYADAKRAQRAELQQRLVAQEVSAFLTSMLSSVDPRKAGGKDVSVLRELVDDASRRLRTDLGGQPVVQAKLEGTLGYVYYSLGVYDKADKLLSSSVSRLRALLGDGHPDTLEAEHNLASLRQDQGRLNEARTLFENVCRARIEVLRPDHPATLTSQNSLGELYIELQEFERAEKLLSEVVARRRRTLGESHADTLVSVNDLSNVLVAQRKCAEAEPLIRDLLARQQATLPEDHLDVFVTKNDLAVALSCLQKRIEAELLYREVMLGFRRLRGPGHIDTLITMSNLAALHSRRGATEESAALYRELVAVATESLPEESHYTAAFRMGFGNVLAELEQYDEAERELVRGYGGLKKALGEHHGYTRQCAASLVRLYERTDRPDKAAPMRPLSKPPVPTP